MRYSKAELKAKQQCFLSGLQDTLRQLNFMTYLESEVYQGRKYVDLLYALSNLYVSSKFLEHVC